MDIAVVIIVLGWDEATRIELIGEGVQRPSSVFARSCVKV